MKKGIPDPLWMMLAANHANERITILGFSEKPEGEALKIARERADRTDSVRIFAMHQNGTQIGRAIHTWLVSEGVPEEEVAQIIKGVAESMRKMIE